MGQLDNKRIVLVGGGAMGEAISNALLNQAGADPQQITVCEPLDARRAYLEAQLGVNVTADNAAAVTQADVVLFAVKPQYINPVLASVKGAIPRKTLVMTIVAGVPIQVYREALDVPAIVRIMPNTPAQIGEGASVWTATAAVDDALHATAQAIIGAMGVEVYMAEERYLDMATALSGTGPAYVFLFIESMIDAGVHMGFARDIAEKLVLQTVKGSVLYAEQTGVHPAILRNRVSSPGGTTVEAMHTLDSAGFRALITDAVVAAFEKSKLLGEVYR